MCVLHTYNILNDKSSDSIIFEGVRPFLEYSIIKYLIYICVRINLIETCLKPLANNFEWRYCEYQENTE